MYSTIARQATARVGQARVSMSSPLRRKCSRPRRCPSTGPCLERIELLPERDTMSTAVAKRVLTELTLPGADAIRADARRFRQLVASDPAQARTAVLFTQGLQTRGPLELDLGDRIGAL